MTHRTTQGRPVRAEHAATVTALCGELISWANANGHQQHPAALMDALVNVCLQVAEHTGTLEQLAEHLVSVGCQRLLEQAMQRHAGFGSTHPTRH